MPEQTETVETTDTQTNAQTDGQGTEETTPSTQQTNSDDLLTRVSKFELNNDPDNKPKDNQDGSQFNSAELEATISGIEDPELKSKMEGLRKSLLSGANNKFQEIATLRKEMKSFMEKDKGNGEWTPQRVQELANDPKFIQAAQQVAGNENTDEYSSLSEEEKGRMKTMQSEIENLKTLNNQALQTSQQQLRETQHNELSSKYANYDRQEIDTITYDMLLNKIKATPEHIYKAFKHDDNVERAYELGRKDEREGVEVKIQSTSAEGITTSVSDEKIIPEKGESSMAFFRKIIDKNLKLAKAKG